jgi:hypothetical protein
MNNYCSIKYIFPIIIGVLAFLFVPFEALDSYRYYSDYGNLIHTDLSVVEFIIFVFLSKSDFIYYLLQYFLVSLSIPIQVLTGIAVALLYSQSYRAIDILKKKLSMKFGILDSFLLHFFILISVSFIAVWSISRNVMGVMFFAYCINSMLKEQKLRAFIFFILAILTHFGLIFYLSIFFSGYFFPFKLRSVIFKSSILFGLIALFAASLFMPTLYHIVYLLPLFNGQYDYGVYLDIMEAHNLFTFTLGWGDKVMFITTFIFLIICLSNIKKITPILNGVLFLFVWLCISFGFSQLHSQRTLLLLIPITGIVGVFFLFENKNRIILYLFRLSVIISIIGFLWNIYSYRGNWMFALPI